jgi:D-galactose 1-dehydrogenase
VNWKEDVRHWHPGQQWIWQAGGFGVFDPGINALSIVTRILPQPLVLKDAELHFPSNCETPIAAELTLQGPGGLPVRADFDFRQTGPQSWDIVVDTDRGSLTLSGGGARLAAGGEVLVEAADAEYRGLYRRFVELAATGTSDVDLVPLRLVADAFLLGRRKIVESFED